MTLLTTIMFPMISLLIAMAAAVEAPPGFHSGLKAVFTSNGTEVEMHVPFPYLAPKAHLKDAGAIPCTHDERYCSPFDATDIAGFTWSDYTVEFLGKMHVGDAQKYQLHLEYSKDACIYIHVGDVHILDECGSEHDRRLENYLLTMTSIEVEEEFEPLIEPGIATEITAAPIDYSSISRETVDTSDEIFYAPEERIQVESWTSKQYVARSVAIPTHDILIDANGFATLNVTYSYHSLSDEWTTPRLVMTSSYVPIDAVSPTDGFEFVTKAQLMLNETNTFIVEENVENIMNATELDEVLAVTRNGKTIALDQFVCFEPHVQCAPAESVGTWFVSGLLFSDENEFSSQLTLNVANMSQLHLLSMNFSTFLAGYSINDSFSSLDTLYINGFDTNAVPRGILFPSLKSIFIHFHGQAIDVVPEPNTPHSPDAQCFPSLLEFSLLENVTFVNVFVSTSNCNLFDIEITENVTSLALVESTIEFPPRLPEGAMVATLDVRGSNFSQGMGYSGFGSFNLVSTDHLLFDGASFDISGVTTFSIPNSNDTVRIEGLALSASTFTLSFSDNVTFVIFDHCSFEELFSITGSNIVSISFEYTDLPQQNAGGSFSLGVPNSVQTISMTGYQNSHFLAEDALTTTFMLQTLELFVGGEEPYTALDITSLQIPNSLRTLRFSPASSHINEITLSLPMESLSNLFSSTGHLEVFEMRRCTTFCVDGSVPTSCSFGFGSTLKEIYLQESRIDAIDLIEATNLEVFDASLSIVSNLNQSEHSPWPSSMHTLILDSSEAVFGDATWQVFPLPSNITFLSLLRIGVASSEASTFPASLREIRISTQLYHTSNITFETLEEGYISNLTKFTMIGSIFQADPSPLVVNLPDGVRDLQLQLSGFADIRFETALTTVENLTMALYSFERYAPSRTTERESAPIGLVFPGDFWRDNFRSLFGPALKHFYIETSGGSEDDSIRMEFGELFQFNNAINLETLRLREVYLPYFNPNDPFILPKNISSFYLENCRFPAGSFPFYFDETDGYIQPLSIVFKALDEFTPEFGGKTFPNVPSGALRIPASTTELILTNAFLVESLDLSHTIHMDILELAIREDMDHLVFPPSIGRMHILCYQSVYELFPDTDGISGTFDLSAYQTKFQGITYVDTATFSRCTFTQTNDSNLLFGLPASTKNLTLTESFIENGLDLSAMQLEFAFLYRVFSTESTVPISFGPTLEVLTVIQVDCTINFEPMTSLRIADIRGSNVTARAFEALQLSTSVQTFVYTDYIDSRTRYRTSGIRGSLSNRFAFDYSNLRYVDLTRNFIRPYDLVTGIAVDDIASQVHVPATVGFLLDQTAMVRFNMTSNSMHGYSYSFDSDKLVLGEDNIVWCSDQEGYCRCVSAPDANATLCTDTTCGSTCFLYQILKASPESFFAPENTTTFEIELFYNNSACFLLYTDPVETLSPATFSLCTTPLDPVASLTIDYTALDTAPFLLPGLGTPLVGVDPATSDLAGYDTYMEALSVGFRRDNLTFNIVINTTDFGEPTTFNIPFEQRCPDGKRFSSSPFACIACEAGRISLGGTAEPCQACIAGRFQNLTGQTACLECQPGSFAAVPGQETCTETPPGTYQPLSGQDTSLACTAGSFQDEFGTIACKSCFAGSYSNSTNATDCIPCELGKSQPDMGQQQCDNCPAGKAANATGSEECYTCEAGRAASTAAAHECSICEAGKYSVTPASLVCNVCESGRYSAVIGATTVNTCSPCPTGTFSNQSGIATVDDCDLCPAGKFGVLTAANQESLCTDCSTGRYTDVQGEETCQLCPSGRFGNSTSAPTADLCYACAPGRYSSFSGVTQCVDCPAGTYNAAPAAESSSDCRPCPEGTVCIEGSRAWSVLPGYYRDPSDSSRILECFPKESCASTGSESQTTCAPGYTGFLCGSCVEYEYYRSGQGCAKCGSQAVKWAMLVLVLLGGSIMLYFILEARGDRMTKYGIRSLITSVQILAVYPKISQDWSPRMLSTFNVFSASNMNIELFSPACSYPMDYFAKWRMVQVFPFVLTAIMSVIFVVASKIRRKPVSLSGIAGSLIYLLVTIYTYLISNALEPYNCSEQADGTFTMVFNPGQECFVGKWNDNRVFFALAAVVYCGLIPIGLFAAFFHFRSVSLRETDTFKNLFGILSMPFKEPFYFWEFIFTLEKVVIVASADILSAQLNSQGIKVFVVISTIFIFHSLNVVLKPYKVDARNNTEAMWALVRLFILVSSFIYASESITSTEKNTFTNLLIAILVISITYTVGSFLLHCRSKSNASKKRLHQNLQICVDDVFKDTPAHFRRSLLNYLRSTDDAVLRTWVAEHMEMAHMVVPKEISQLGTATCDYDSDDGLTERKPVPKSHTVVTRALKKARSVPQVTPWRTVISDDGVPYYYNIDTGETRWDMPTFALEGSSDSE